MTFCPAGTTKNPSVAAGVLYRFAAPTLVLKRFFPVAGSNAYSVPVEASIAQRAPAAVTGGPR